MQSKYHSFLRDCLGEDGLEALQKTIQREGYTIPTEMQEQYLAMMVVPHSLLAWVLATTKKLDEGGNKEVEVPGHIGTKLLLNKVKNDIYTGYLHKDGQILHRFVGLSIPQLAGHLMTCLEMYDGVDSKVAADPKVVSGIAPLIDKLVQDRFAAPAMPAINITINTGAPAPKVEAPGFVTEPPVMKGPAPVEETSEESKKPKAKKDEESDSSLEKRRVSESHPRQGQTAGGPEGGASIQDEVAEGERAVQHYATRQVGPDVGAKPSQGDMKASPKMSRSREKVVEQHGMAPGYKNEDEESSSSSSASDGKVTKLPDGSGFFTGTVKAEESTTISTSETSRLTSKSEPDLKALATQLVDRAIKESKPKPFGLTLTKKEMDLRCPDCGGSEFENETFVGCICMSSMQDCKVKVVKNEDGTYRLKFGKRWTADDLKMFLDIIKRDSHE